MNLKKVLIKEWGKLKEVHQIKLLTFLEKTINYFLTSLFFSIPLCLFFDFVWWRTILSIFLILPFLEHYYVWLREKWKDDILK